MKLRIRHIYLRFPLHASHKLFDLLYSIYIFMYVYSPTLHVDLEGFVRPVYLALR